VQASLQCCAVIVRSSIENLWIKVTKGCNKYIIGAIYRHPGYKINTFTEKMDALLTQITKRRLPCIIAGDVNIDL